MTRATVQDARTAAEHFRLFGAVQDVAPHGEGRIHDSFRVTCTPAAGGPSTFLLQHLNTTVFHDVPALMENIARVTGHLQVGYQVEGVDDPERRALTLVPTRDGTAFHTDAQGAAWRCYEFIEGTHTLPAVETPDQARACARAFADFQRRLADLPPPRLHVTIPGFHDTRRRLATFRSVLKHDPLRRAASAQDEIAFALDRAGLADGLELARRSGRLPERVTHNDTKINNLLFDNATGETLCVVDLDTVMPGLALYDFGDLVRSAVNSAAENEPDMGQVGCRLDIFEGLVCGYLEGGRAFLLPEEISRMALAGRVLAYELGLRFLTDHLEGDTYFPVGQAGDNLRRSRIQFALALAMEKATVRMEGIVARYAGT